MKLNRKLNWSTYKREEAGKSALIGVKNRAKQNKMRIKLNIRRSSRNLRRKWLRRSDRKRRKKKSRIIV
jgi:hypothetical protein